MTGQELEDLRERMGVLTQEAMAELLQCDAVGYRRYVTGARPVPRYIERSAKVLEFVHRQGLMAKLQKVLDVRRQAS